MRHDKVVQKQLCLSKHSEHLDKYLTDLNGLMPFYFILNKYENLCLIIIKAFDKLHTLLISIHLLKGQTFSLSERLYRTAKNTHAIEIGQENCPLSRPMELCFTPITSQFSPIFKGASEDENPCQKASQCRLEKVFIWILNTCYFCNSLATRRNVEQKYHWWDILLNSMVQSWMTKKMYT